MCIHCLYVFICGDHPKFNATASAEYMYTLVKFYPYFSLYSSLNCRGGNFQLQKLGAYEIGYLVHGECADSCINNTRDNRKMMSASLHCLYFVHKVIGDVLMQAE